MVRKTGKNKKGSAADLILISVAVLFASIMILIGFKVMNSFNTQIQGMAIDSDAKAISTEMTAHYPGVVDNSFVLIIMFLSLVALVAAALVRVHPIFIVLFIIMWIFIIFLCGAFSNIYQEMASNPNLIAEASQMNTMTSVLTYLPIIIGVIGILLMIVMYKAWGDNQ